MECLARQSLPRYRFVCMVILSLATTRVCAQLIVSSIKVTPYLMTYTDASGQLQYYGYIRDLLDVVMSILGETYTIELSPDGKYGNLQPGGVWDGMVEQVYKRRVDLAAGPLYITFPRATVVDFCRPFMNISTTFLVTRNYLQQNPHIRDVASLIRQPDVRVGTMRKGTIVRAFKTTNNSLYQSIWQKISNFAPYVFTDSNEEGIDRVRSSSGQFTFILPSDIADYVSRQEPCDLVAFARFMNNRHFAFAVPKQSALLPRLNQALLHLEQTGLLVNLYTKWWKVTTDCNDPASTSHLTSLAGANKHIGYTFRVHVVYIMGCLLFVSYLARF